MTKTYGIGRKLALEALAGKPTTRVPVGLFTWEFDYLWKVAGLEPWQLACGDHETWHRAHIALLERHQPDILWYSGAGSAATPRLLEEDGEKWVIESGGRRCGLRKDSLSLYDMETHVKGCDSVGEIRSVADADRLVPEFKGWGESYLAGLSRLIHDAGDRALVLPHHSPAYICACYAFGFERAMEVILAEPELFHYVCDRYAAGDRLRMQEWEAAGAEACFFADGWASCDIISPAMVEEFALPYQRSVTEAAHEAGLRIILWNEGDILPILAQEAAIPMDAFAFEQPRKGVQISVDKVRAVFGPKRCLFGNLDSELLLLRNDPAEIAAAVREQIRQSGPGAPFILSTGSPLQSDLEPAAVDAMISAVRSLN
ncbi:MAG: uroporphyrinogen decarboxylase family protein [Victivallales bacterium]